MGLKGEKMKIKYLSSILIILVLCTCSTVNVKKSSALTNRAEELETIIKSNKPLTPSQKMIMKHTAKELRETDKTIKQQEKELDKTEKKLISESKLAGSGQLIYVLIGLAGLGIIGFIVYKIKSFLS